MQMASKNLMETLSEVYENEWPGHDLLYMQSQNSQIFVLNTSKLDGDQRKTFQISLIIVCNVIKGTLINL
jgi:hypothetical protein